MTNAYRTELKGKILIAASELFGQKGIRGVKMDDIAAHLSISKRTLYEIYHDKEELLREVVVKGSEDFHNEVARRINPDSNVIDILMIAYSVQMERFATVSPLFFEEMAQYPEILDIVKANDKKRQKETMGFIGRGISEGLLQKDINYDIALRMGSMIFHDIMQQRLYHKFPLEEIIRTSIFIIFRGICTVKGVAMLDKYLDEQK